MLRSFLSNAELFLDQAKTRWKTAKAHAIARGAHRTRDPLVRPSACGSLSAE